MTEEFSSVRAITMAKVDSQRDGSVGSVGTEHKSPTLRIPYVEGHEMLSSFLNSPVNCVYVGPGGPRALR